MIFKITRTVPTNKRNVDEMLEEAVETILTQATVSKSLEADGLLRKREVKFLKGFVPGQDEDNNFLGLSGPKLDLTYGIEKPGYQEAGRGLALLSPEIEAMVKFAPGIIYPFFVVEFKSYAQSIEKAENQAIRSGAALVESHRRLNAQVLRPIANSPPSEAVLATVADLSSIAFSVSWVAQFAKLHVHWYE
ncbi:MAG: hypothetical protein Q9214_006395 [Letrouitia sp. 1 TL-2023]